MQCFGDPSHRRNKYIMGCILKQSTALSIENAVRLQHNASLKPHSVKIFPEMTLKTQYEKCMKCSHFITYSLLR